MVDPEPGDTQGAGGDRRNRGTESDATSAAGDGCVPSGQSRFGRRHVEEPDRNGDRALNRPH